MGGAAFVGTLQLQYDLAGAVTLEPIVGDRWAGDIAAQVLRPRTRTILEVETWDHGAKSQSESLRN
jgi:hypothetical protein